MLTGGAVAPERLAGSSWVPIKASRWRKASPLEVGRLPHLLALDRSTAKARSEGATAPPSTEGLRRKKRKWDGRFKTLPTDNT